MAFIPEGTIRVLRVLKERDYTDTFTRMVQEQVESGNSYGKPVYTESYSYACRFVPKPSPDVLPTSEVEMTDAELFISRSTPLTGKDQVRITHIHGDAVEPLDYEIVAGPVLDSLGQSMTLKLVQR